MKTLAVCQSNYIPWKGYFDLINSADEFILYDDVQYTRSDWRNRNLIKSANGPLWLTIPVSIKGRFGELVKDKTVSDPRWSVKHWKTISQAYAKAPGFSACKDWLEELYRTALGDRLSLINRHFIEGINTMLGIRTPMRWSMEFDLPEDRNERLVALCQQTGATGYISGPAARSYLDEPLFARAGIQVEWIDYSGYPEYRQLFPPFEHQVSIIDLILSQGSDAPKYMKSFSRPRK